MHVAPYAGQRKHLLIDLQTDQDAKLITASAQATIEIEEKRAKQREADLKHGPVRQRKKMIFHIDRAIDMARHREPCPAFAR